MLKRIESLKPSFEYFSSSYLFHKFHHPWSGQQKPDAASASAPAHVKHAVEVQPVKRPQASPARTDSVAPYPVGQSPVKPSDAKKPRKEDTDPTQLDRVAEYNSERAARSDSPVKDLMDITEDVLDRTHPTPKKLEFEGGAGVTETLLEPPTMTIDLDSAVEVSWLKSTLQQLLSTTSMTVE